MSNNNIPDYLKDLLPKDNSEEFMKSFEDKKQVAEDSNDGIPENIQKQIKVGTEKAILNFGAAHAYAERICNGEFPITYTREQVVHHSANDFLAGCEFVMLNETTLEIVQLLKDYADALKRSNDETEFDARLQELNWNPRLFEILKKT